MKVFALKSALAFFGLGLLFFTSEALADIEQVYLKVISEEAELRDAPGIANSKVLDLAKAGWLFQISDLKTADDGSQWYEVYRVNDDKTGFKYIYRLYQMPGSELYINKDDVIVIPNPEYNYMDIEKNKNFFIYKLDGMKGRPVKAVRYIDAASDNLVFLTETDFFYTPENGQDWSKELFAYQYILNENRSATQAWNENDYIHDCVASLEVAFELAGFQITDLDNNGQAEVWLTRYLSCRGDPSPVEIKITMHEGDHLYKVEGESMPIIGDDGGEFTLSPNFNRNAPAFKAFAIKLWAAFVNYDAVDKKPKNVAPPNANNLVIHDFPVFKGEIVKAVRYHDEAGDNLVMLLNTPVFQTPGSDYADHERSRELFAHHFILEKDGAVKPTWSVTDFVRGCYLDGLTASFIEDAFRVTDLDKNGLAEVWVAYVLDCAGAPGPMTMKIIMYEQGRKYAMRGQSRSLVNENDYRGGKYQFDEAFVSGPPQFRAFAEELWAEYKTQ